MLLFSSFKFLVGILFGSSRFTDSLDSYEFPDEKVSEGLDDIDNIV